MSETLSEKHDRLNGEALDRLYPLYGQAMLNWSNVEDCLCEWFHYLSGMKYPQARAVFFSARGFAARADMLSALLDFPDEKRFVLEFVRDSLNKSIGYSQVRNRLAHRIPVINTTNDQCHIVELHEGGAHPFLSGAPILGAHLTIISDNYAKLGRINRDAWLLTREKDSKERQERLQECHEKLLLLPSQADSNELSRKQRGRELQRKSSRK
ncbi:MAG: hypothetical protein EOS36_15460 [Mesorhizobium sp.]|uniref:hypothetical protein n=1 Tax=Mesorhizobium sp. TaxID=1871066 RepID=UPI000FE57757|nr:hypothetical protein [Mesorhizobium sp.]RWD62318.1 MAG: hypothetical protein EOS36_15460 [Mesorhizobium sp.]RWE46911.1 MAG: hypothetical protein EOS79_11075 [Mesorhizobium sp.]